MKKENILLAIMIVLIIGAILIIGIDKPKANNLEDQNSTQTLNANTQTAPELSGISGYFNTDNNLTIKSLRGKVVIVDFWTYSCINCIRTLPYLNAWYDKYHSFGLEIIGVHSPEFDFEKDPNNVKMAIEKYNIKFPVVQDNDFSTWRSYNNHYWPHKFLIDSKGVVRYDHIGEGSYEETEKQIQELLNEINTLQSTKTVSNELTSQTPNFNMIKTPEIYFGTDFERQELGNPKQLDETNTAVYTFPDQLSNNYAYLEGTWKKTADSMQLISETGKIKLPFSARQVNIVAGNYFQDSIVKSSFDKTTQTQNIIINSQTLYTVGELPDYTNDTITLDINGKGFRIYTFTFG